MTIPLNTGLPAWNPPYETAWKLHVETGLFPFLIECFQICRARDYPLPEALLQAMERHFDQLAKAGTVKEARQALGLGQRPTQKSATARGGEAGYYRNAKTRAKQENIVSLVDHMAVMGVKPMPACFKLVAEYTETPWRQVRKIYHERRRELIKSHDDLLPLPRHSVRPEIVAAGQHGGRL